MSLDGKDPVAVRRPNLLGASDLSSNERGWLLDVEAAVDFDDANLAELFPAPTLERARQTFVLLTR